MSKVLKNKRIVINQKGSTSEYTLNFLYDLFANQDTYEKNSSTFRASYEEWKQNRVLALELIVLRHVLFPNNITRIDIQFLQFQEQIEQGYTFVPALQYK